MLKLQTPFVAAVAALTLAVSLAATPAPRGAVPTRGTPIAPRPAGRELEAWLNQHKSIADRVAWVTGDGARQEFANWSPAQKARIELFFADLVANNRNLGMHLPNPATANGYFTADAAFDIFAAHVAHVVYLQSHNLVPWKIDQLPPEQLDLLVCSLSYFSMIQPSTTSLPAGIQPRRDLQAIAQESLADEYTSDPRIGYEFLSGKTSASGTSLIAKDPLDTLKNLTLWLRDNVAHGDIDGKNGERAKKLYWLDDRLRPFPGQRTACANLGCHSAAKLMVDLARSVNIPLLNVFALDPQSGDDKINILSRSHGSLIYDYQGPATRVLWHVDHAYAREGCICFPIDDKTGKLLPKDQADQLFFDTCWFTPAEMIKAGFDYKIERIFPNQGVGHDSAGPDVNRSEYGFSDGEWRGTGKAHLDEMFEWVQDYQVCGAPLLDLAARNVVTAQLQSDMSEWQGKLKPAELPKIPSWDDFEKRAAAGLKAVGGPQKLAQLEKQAAARRGSNLLKPGITYDGRKD